MAVQVHSQRGINPLDYPRAFMRELKEAEFFPKIPIIEEMPYPEIVTKDGERFLGFGSNCYLGLAVHPEVIEAAAEATRKYGVGTCESRILTGNLDILVQLEEAIAAFKKTEAAIIYATGLLANLGIIPGIINRDVLGLSTRPEGEGLIVCDFFSHQSIRLGCKLAESSVKTYRHNDMEHLEKVLQRALDHNSHRRILIVTDGVFSMHGDLAPLPDILDLAEKYNAAVMVDDAHATGVLGPNGRGTAEYFGVEDRVHLSMGTLSKAFGGMGGFLATDREVADALRCKSVPYIFTSSLPPSQAAAMLKSCEIIQTRPALREAFWQNVQYLREGLEGLGLNVLGNSHILSVHIGDEEIALGIERFLKEEKGILVRSITKPAVPGGQALFRFTTMATHTQEQIDYLLESLGEAIERFALIPSQPIAIPA